MSTDKLRGYNAQIKTLIDNRDLNNPDIKKLIKIQKVRSFQNVAHDLQHPQSWNPTERLPHLSK